MENRRRKLKLYDVIYTIFGDNKFPVHRHTINFISLKSADSETEKFNKTLQRFVETDEKTGKKKIEYRPVFLRIPNSPHFKLYLETPALKRKHKQFTIAKFLTDGVNWTEVPGKKLEQIHKIIQNEK